ncbi:MAG: hypothetical protein WCD35_10880 [Mycobacteriales bacterium]
MTTTTSARPDVETPAQSAGSSTLFTSLVGLTALAVLLQGLFAGVFLEHDGERDASGSWIDAHANGAHAATLLAIAAAVVAFVKLRDRRSLVVGSALLALLLLVESFIGGLIRDQSKDTLTVVHVPLAMAVMGVTVWLSAKAAHLRRSA